MAAGLIWIPYQRAYDHLILWPAAVCAGGLWSGTRTAGLGLLPLAAFLVLPLTDLSLALPAVLMALLVARMSIRNPAAPYPASEAPIN